MGLCPCNPLCGGCCSYPGCERARAAQLSWERGNTAANTCPGPGRGLRCHKSQRQLPRARRPGSGREIRPRGHSPGSERGEGGAGKGNLPPVPDGSTGGPCWRHGKGVHWRQQGMVLGGKQSAALLSLSLRLLHRGAGQLLAPNLYQLSKYSCPDTGCWIARGRNSVPHRQQLVKHLTPSLLWAGSLFLSCRKESEPVRLDPCLQRASWQGGSHQAQTEIQVWPLISLGNAVQDEPLQPNGK